MEGGALKVNLLLATFGKKPRHPLAAQCELGHSPSLTDPVKGLGS